MEVALQEPGQDRPQQKPVLRARQAACRAEQPQEGGQRQDEEELAHEGARETIAPDRKSEVPAQGERLDLGDAELGDQLGEEELEVIPSTDEEEADALPPGRPDPGDLEEPLQGEVNGQ